MTRPIYMLLAFFCIILMVFPILPLITQKESASFANNFNSADPILWPVGTCKYVDTTDDAGGRLFRDILAVYYYEAEMALYFRVDFLKLQDLNYESMNVYILIDFEAGGQSYLPDYIWDGQVRGWEWELCAVIYNSSSGKLYDLNWNVIDGLTWIYHDFQGMLALNISKNTAANYGFSDGETVHIRVATVKDGESGLWDIAPNDDLTDGYWDGAVSSDSSTITAKLAFVHHGNQHINPFSGGVVDDGLGHGFYRTLDTHETYNLPVNLHLSGVLITGLAWNKPSFLERIRNLTSKGLVEILGGVYGEHIMPYLDEPLNLWALNKHKELCHFYFNYTPRVAWIPERVWKYFIDNDIVEAGYEAVILDGETHHDDYCSCGNYHLTHKISSVYNLYAFFICEKWYGTDVPSANSDWHLDLKRHWAAIVRAGDERQICVYGDDWEKAAGVANWPQGNPNNYDSLIRWIAGAKAWIQVVKLSDYLDWYSQPTSGRTITIYEDTYGALKYWTGGTYDNWYNDFKNWKPYGCTKTAETLWKDVLSALNYQSSFNLSTAAGRFRELAMWVLAANLYETGWHEGDDLAGWGKEIWAHSRYAMILAKAAEWAENPPSCPQIFWEDVDDDGSDELVLCNDKLFMVMEHIGGRIVFIGTIDGRVELGNYMVEYRGTEGDYNDDDHVGALTDKWYTFNSHDYSHDIYSLSIDFLNQTHAQAVATSPDGYITKRVLLTKGSYGIRVNYDLKHSGTLYVRLGSFSPDLYTLLYYGKNVLKLLGSGGQGYMGWRNTVTNTSIVVAWQYPGAAYSYSWTLTFAKMVEIKSLNTKFCFDLIAGPLEDTSKLSFETLYKLHVNVNTSFAEGRKLIAAFYKYDGSPQANLTIWTGVTPNWIIISADIWHPLQKPIERVSILMLDSEGKVISTLTTLVVSKENLYDRLNYLKSIWATASSEEKICLMKEIVAIDSQLPYAPEGVP